MTLTPEQRYTMYCIMMAEIEDGYKIENNGFCLLWEHITGEFICGERHYRLSEPLPELFAKRTIDPICWYSCWFNDNTPERITALQQCIEELEKQLYS